MLLWKTLQQNLIICSTFRSHISPYRSALPLPALQEASKSVNVKISYETVRECIESKKWPKHDLIAVKLIKELPPSSVVQKT